MQRSSSGKILLLIRYNHAEHGPATLFCLIQSDRTIQINAFDKISSFKSFSRLNSESHSIQNTGNFLMRIVQYYLKIQMVVTCHPMCMRIACMWDKTIFFGPTFIASTVRNTMNNPSNFCSYVIPPSPGSATPYSAIFSRLLLLQPETETNSSSTLLFKMARAI